MIFQFKAQIDTDNTEILKKPEKVEMRKLKPLSNEFWILMNSTDGQMFIWDSLSRHKIE